MTDTAPSAARLESVFLSAAPAAVNSDSLGERLRALLLAAQSAHPTIPLDAERFIRHLARHCATDEAPGEWLGSIGAGDLYLACACAEGVPAAIAVLDQQYRSQVGSYLARMRPEPAFVDDVAQAVRERLLVGVGGSPPRISEYAGRGSLASWLRVVTVRLALDLRRRRTEELACNGTVVDGSFSAAPESPEIEMIKHRYASSINDAVRAAVGALPKEQRSLLRRHFVDGATLDDLAAASGVHRATIARRIAAARGAIFTGARKRLCAELALPPAEIESLMGLLRSQIDLSLSRG